MKLELAEVYIPHNAREHIKALLPYATGKRMSITSEAGVVGWELDLLIPKRLINPDVDIEFLRRNRISMHVESGEVNDYGSLIMHESQYYKIKLSFNE